MGKTVGLGKLGTGLIVNDSAARPALSA